MRQSALRDGTSGSPSQEQLVGGEFASADPQLGRD
jgi:hypothetical protein